MKLLAVVFCLSQLYVCDAASVYPAKYPFDKENVEMPTLPETKPYDNADYDKADNPGGYMARQFTCDPYSDDRLAFQDAYKASVPAEYLTEKRAGFRECRAQAYQQWNVKKSVGKASSQNCTSYLSANARVSSSALWTTNVIDGTKVCDAGKCCSMLNNVMIVNMGRTQDGFTKNIPALKLAGSCGTLPPEPVMCADAAHATVCLEYFPEGKTNARVSVLPCYDGYWRWMMSCPVFKNAASSIYEAVSQISSWETKTYTDKLSVGQLAKLAGGVSHPDRVCNPYSYYYPSEAADAPNTNTVTNTPSSSSKVSVAGFNNLIGVVAIFVLP